MKSSLIIFLLLINTIHNMKFFKNQEYHETFSKEKEKIEKGMNGRRLANYLRELMLKNNAMLDKEIIFIEHEDFENIESEDLNYNTLQMNPKDDYEFKARIIAYKWSQTHHKGKTLLKPFSVQKEKELKHGWKNYMVLLMGGEQSILKRICFPNELTDNLSIVLPYEKTCNNKINSLYDSNVMEDGQIQQQQSEELNGNKRENKKDPENHKQLHKHKILHNRQEKENKTKNIKHDNIPIVKQSKEINSSSTKMEHQKSQQEEVDFEQLNLENSLI
jgi:hypothetical protein